MTRLGTVPCSDLFEMLSWNLLAREWGGGDGGSWKYLEPWKIRGFELRVGSTTFVTTPSKDWILVAFIVFLDDCWCSSYICVDPRRISIHIAQTNNLFCFIILYRTTVNWPSGKELCYLSIIYLSNASAYLCFNLMVPEMVEVIGWLRLESPIILIFCSMTTLSLYFDNL